MSMPRYVPRAAERGDEDRRDARGCDGRESQRNAVIEVLPKRGVAYSLRYD